ncbi:MAG TPA: hypothetical protein VHO03_09455 [Ignavibacteriales bacterium]|nr:hypothetical protein [Ignavibacteriales bacterium]
MKKLLVLSLIALSIFLLSSCSKDNVTTPEKSGVELTMGKVSLRIDKVNAPSDVSVVTATLSRTEGDTLIKDLSMIGDSSSAEISFENIKTGVWHLRIEAKNTANAVLYSGETDILIEDSKTTEVYLTLTPKPTGMGSVYISVKWGTPGGWTDYPGNPVFTGSQALGNPFGGVAASKVLFENGKYRMWYMNTYEAGNGDINYAESVDGIHWHNVLDKPVLTHGKPGSWDSLMVGITSLVKDEEGYKMYYYAFGSGNRSNYATGLAYSQDGITWQKKPEPIIASTDPDAGTCFSGAVKKGSMYYMFYTSLYTPYNINMAESQDGIHWTKYSGNPVVRPDQPWEYNGIIYPSVIYDGKQFIMVYGVSDRNALGLATSTDGITWKKDSRNPVIKLQDTYRQWTSVLNYPWLLKTGNEMRIYYTGAVNGQFEMAAAICN